MSRVAVVSAAAFALLAAPAAAQDYAATARNIIPSGQYGTAPPPAGADQQALMYDALTPLFDQVTTGDLFTFFKSEHFGLGEDGPGTVEPVPRAGVTVVRDRFHVPHITGQSRDDVTWAMGWLLAQDRGLLLAQARDAARLAAIDAPNIDAFGLVINLRRYTPTKAVDRMIQRQGDAALKGAGAAGAAVRHDIDVYLEGMNARLRRTARAPGRGRGSTSTPPTRSRARSSARAAGTRRGGRSSSTGCASATARAAASGSSTTCPSSRTPIPPPR